jgi:hypothetical protein
MDSVMALPRNILRLCEKYIMSRNFIGPNDSHCSAWFVVDPNMTFSRSMRIAVIGEPVKGFLSAIYTMDREEIEKRVGENMVTIGT